MSGRGRDGSLRLGLDGSDPIKGLKYFSIAVSYNYPFEWLTVTLAVEMVEYDSLFVKGYNDKKVSYVHDINGQMRYRN